MSWDIVLFNSKQKIKAVEEVDETLLEPTDFCSAFKEYFENIMANDDHREVRGQSFAINYSVDEAPVSNKVLSMYGEDGFYELIILSQKHNWQIFDTGLGEMLDLENPTNNGYQKFQEYLNSVTGKK